MKKATVLASLMIALTVLLSVGAQAQEPDVPSKVEVGVQFSSLTPSSQSSQGFNISASVRSKTDAAGFGGRLTFNLTKHVALEAEGNFFPHKDDSSLSSGGQLLQGQFGVKAGKRFGKFGIFAKARPGFASFSRVFTQVGTTTIDFNGQRVEFPNFELKRKTHFSMDLGGVLEFYPSRRVLTRLDVGDTIIRYGSASFSPIDGQTVTFIPVSRTSHNFQLSAGVGFRLGSIKPEETTPQTQVNKKQRIEVGAQFSSLSFTQVDHIPGVLPFISPRDFRDTQTQAGFGGRFTYNLTPNFALEMQADFYPRDAGLFNNARVGGRNLQGQAGIKIGKRFESFGIFGKARPGVVSFSKTLKFDGIDNTQPFPVAILHLERRTYFSFDLGGVLEFYPSPRIVTRFDGGDTMIRYGRTEVPFPFSGSAPPETIHNFQFSAGVGFRF
jgi:hypothetical protein